MATPRYAVYHDRPHIPIQHTSWFIQLLMVLAALILAGVVYGFWSIAQTPSPTLDLPDVPRPVQPAQ